LSLRFEWDEIKSKTNLIKHRVSFTESKTVFYDDFARIKADPDHSIKEDRFIIIGYSDKNRLLVTSFTERNEMIRIISSRKATKTERLQYENFV
jgi:uncharacterized protein